MKAELRHTLRTARNSLSRQQQQQAAISLFEQFQLSPFFANERIALYLANDGEIDPNLILNHLLGTGKKAALPYIHNEEMRFTLVDESTEMTTNRFGIAEPVEPKTIETQDLDVVLMPLVGFDESGNRLGMGGGFYDRALAFKKEQTESKPTLIGLAHECQKVEKLEADEWDIPLNGILTDQRYLSFS